MHHQDLIRCLSTVAVVCAPFLAASAEQAKPPIPERTPSAAMSTEKVAPLPSPTVTLVSAASKRSPVLKAKGAPAPQPLTDTEVRNALAEIVRQSGASPISNHYSPGSSAPAHRIRPLHLGPDALTNGGDQVMLSDLMFIAGASQRNRAQAIMMNEAGRVTVGLNQLAVGALYMLSCDIAPNRLPGTFDLNAGRGSVGQQIIPVKDHVILGFRASPVGTNEPFQDEFAIERNQDEVAANRGGPQTTERLTWSFYGCDLYSVQ